MLCSFLMLGLLAACQPAKPPETLSQPTAQASPEAVEGEASEIPWAPGESAETSTREVIEQPGSMDDPLAVDEVDEGVPNQGMTMPASGACSGRSPLPLRAEVQARAAEVKACGEEVSVTGLLRYTLRIDDKGQVTTLLVLEDTVDDRAVRACVEATLSRAFQELPQGGCVQFVVPVEFVSGSTPP